MPEVNSTGSSRSGPDSPVRRPAQQTASKDRVAPDPAELERWIATGEDWLIRRVIKYAKRQGYTKYTSTLEEAWRIAIRELSRALGEALHVASRLTEFRPDEAFEDDPASAFAVLEANRHRERGIDLKMFLGLFKYYRQTYLDRVMEGPFSGVSLQRALFLVNRIFDRWEIAFCSAWATMGEEERLSELQETNRRITNEKNRFLTVTESLGSPVILLDRQRCITYANAAAAPLLGIPPGPGSYYYRQESMQLVVPDWLAALVQRAEHSRDTQYSEHIWIDTGKKRDFEVSLHPMLDISEKFEGTVVIFHEITAQRRAEQELENKARELERLSFTDQLTGLLNRRGLRTLAEKQLALARRTGRPLSVLYADVDNLKVLNDRFGHEIGDLALVAMATALSRSVRTADIVARIGGDEFVVLLPDRAGESDGGILDRVNHQLSRELGTMEPPIDLSFSIGWADFDPSRHDDLNQLLREADSNMYVNKRSRRGAGHLSP